jgi:hypothetical protein
VQHKGSLEEDGLTLQDQDLGISDDEGKLALQEVDLGVGKDVVMDGLDVLQNVYIPLYVGARCNKLTGILVLMNMCTIHGCSNKFVDDLFSILHKSLLHVDNYLFSNMHGAKTLTQQIGLKYKQIHACIYGCILYNGEYANFTHCPKCGKERYKHAKWAEVPMKILCHFPLIPSLKWMYRSYTMSQLLQWHVENKSMDGLVHHVANSMGTHR